MTTPPSLLMTATPNVPDCSIQVDHDQPGIMTLSHGKAGSAEVVEDGPVEITDPVEVGSTTYRYAWVLTGLSGVVPFDYYATCVFGTDSNQTSWTQPATGDGTLVINFPDIATTRIAKIGNVAGLISMRGYASVEEWSELKRLIHSITYRGNMVQVDEL